MSVLEVVAPIFILALAGYLAAAARLLSARDFEGLTRFVFMLAIPALLFQSMANLELSSLFNLPYLAAYYSGTLTVYLLAMGLGKRWFGQNSAEQGIFGLGATFSNSIFIGLPIVQRAYGEAGLAPLFLLLSVHSAILMLVASIAISRQNQQQGLRQISLEIGRSLARNPVIVGLAAGIAFNLSGWTLPTPLAEAVRLLGAATVPGALLALGGSLHAHKLGGQARQVGVMVTLKLALQPLVVALLMFGVFRFNPTWAAVAVTVAGLPTGVNAYLFAQHYRIGATALSAAILVSTLLAVFSQSFLLWAFSSP